MDEKVTIHRKQIVLALKQAELPTSVPDVYRKLGISDSTCYTLRKKYSVISPSELKHMRQLKDENLRLKKLVADISLDKAILQHGLAKRADAGTPTRMGQGFKGPYGASNKQTCFVLRLSRSSFRYCSLAADDCALRLRIREITEKRIHYGYRRVHVMFRRESWHDNHKRTYLLYCEQGLQLRLKGTRHNKTAQRRQPQSRVYIQTTSGAWTLFLMCFLTGDDCTC